MQTSSPHHLEGRLNAHRKMLLALSAFLASNAEGRAFLERFAQENEAVSDHEEDPGMDPGDGFAIQNIADDEVQAIVRAALKRVDAVEKGDRLIRDNDQPT